MSHRVGWGHVIRLRYMLRHGQHHGLADRLTHRRWVYSDVGDTSVGHRMVGHVRHVWRLRHLAVWLHYQVWNWVRSTRYSLLGRNREMQWLVGRVDQGIRSDNATWDGIIFRLLLSYVLLVLCHAQSIPGICVQVQVSTVKLALEAVYASR